MPPGMVPPLPHGSPTRPTVRVDVSAKPPKRQPTLESRTPRAAASAPFSPLGQPREGTQDSMQPPDGFSDSSGKMWMLYISEAEKHDKEISKNLKGDMEGILVFTGLFSAAIAAFLIESYQRLSPDSGDQTVALLTQISGQLNGSTVRVNVMWFLSLVLSLICALSATLMQQWWRRYQQLTQRRGTPHKRGRVRAYLFRGIERSRLRFFIDAITTILHASVGLFLAGLFDFLLPINKTVAFVVLGFEAIFALVYFAITLAPSISFDSPYNTPLSGAVWRFSQAVAIVLLKSINILRRGLEERIALHDKRLKEGLRGSILRSAEVAPSDVDKEALQWTLRELDEEWEIDTFVLRIPGFFDFFDSAGVKDAHRTMLGLLEPEPDDHTEPILCFRIYNTITSCLAESMTPNSKATQRRLHGCLRALWYCARAYCTTDAIAAMPTYFRTRFTDSGFLNGLQNHSDPNVRIISHCIATLLALRLIRDARGRIETAGPRSSLFRSEGGPLLTLIPQRPEVLSGPMLLQAGPAELVNIKAFTARALHIVSTSKLSTRAMEILSETFSTLRTQLPQFDVNIPSELTNEARSFFENPTTDLHPLFRDEHELNSLPQRLKELYDGAPQTTMEPINMVIPGASTAADPNQPGTQLEVFNEDAAEGKSSVMLDQDAQNVPDSHREDNRTHSRILSCIPRGFW
ncbi:hypothetical protein BC834DRAFT_969694 [Gloeopeniophorella convolvens]|nr:hypothetical protein BC834DRAFT_969694 [Gloeopeniophorella convolvens]